MVATAPTTTTQAEALSALVQATVATVLGPLVVELGASRQTIERQAERLEAQAETIGRVTAERDAALSQLAAVQEPQPAPVAVTTPSEPADPVWRRWWVLLLVLGGLLAVILMLAWPR